MLNGLYKAEHFHFWSVQHKRILVVLDASCDHMSYVIIFHQWIDHPILMIFFDHFWNDFEFESTKSRGESCQAHALLSSGRCSKVGSREVDDELGLPGQIGHQ